MQIKIEFTKNWFEMDDTKVIYSTQPHVDKLCADNKLQGGIGLFLGHVLEIRTTKSGNYIINDSKRELLDYEGTRFRCTSFIQFDNGWRLITREETIKLIEENNLSFINQQLSHNDLEV